MRKLFGAAKNAPEQSVLWCECTHRIEHHEITGGLLSRCLHCACRNYRPVILRPGKEGAMRTRKPCPAAIALGVADRDKRHLRRQFRRERRFMRRLALGVIAAGFIFAGVLVF